MSAEAVTSCLPCGLHTPERSAYFDGRLLLARDFVAEQDYHRGHRQLHNSLLHGTGTVCGLKLVQHPSPDCLRRFVVLEPGMVLDCCGQEIVVPARTLVPVASMLAADPDLAEALDGERHLVVAIRRCDSGSEPVPAILPGCAGVGGPTEFGRIAEGFEFVLTARAPADLAPVATPLRAKLRWVHTVVLGAQTPRRVHLNEAEDRVQVAADADAGGAHLHLYDDVTHDLVSMLEGPSRITDTAAGRVARLILAAGAVDGAGEGSPTGGIAFWRAADVTEDAQPAGVLPIEGLAARIAVSPTSGALVVLDLVAPDRTGLLSYSAESIDAWLSGGPEPEPIQRMEFEHGFGDESGPALRGASMMRFSHDGRFLAVAAGPQGCYLIDMSAFHAGGITPAAALADGIEAGTDVVALDFSLDDAFLHLLTRVPGGEGGERAVLTRHARTGDGNHVERRGRGVSLAGTPRDLAVAPAETHAYLLLDDPAGISRLSTVDMARVVAVDGAEPEPVELSADAVRIEGDGRAVALASDGGRIYVAAADAEPAGLPDRGMVAVIDITEDDCSVHIDRLVDGCAGCGTTDTGCGCGGTGRAAPDAGGEHAVVLGHLPFYSAADTPRMMDAGNGGDDDVAIDNLTFRPIVPSAATLRDVIECMLARGIAQGPPGPRGDPGTDGADGLSIDTVQVELGPPGSAPTGSVTPTDTGLTLHLELPAAAPGADGVGIDDARIEYIAGLPAPVVTIVEEAGRRILDIDLPAPDAGTGTPPVNPIVALSWHHTDAYPNRAASSFTKEIQELGVAVAFKAPVLFQPFTGSPRHGPTMLVELQRLDQFRGGTSVWATLDQMHAFPIRNVQIDGSGLLTGWDEEISLDVCEGFALRAPEGINNIQFRQNETLRLVFYADFVLDVEGNPVAGAHIGGLLPTGAGGPGGTFRSWFTIREP